MSMNLDWLPVREEDNGAFTLVGNELRSNATYDFEAKNSYPYS